MNQDSLSVGFTGPRRGMTHPQRLRLAQGLERLLKHAGELTLHHGDCIGADSQAHDIAEGLGITIEIHPPSCSKLRAFRSAPVIHPPYPYLERNRHIANCCDILVAGPDGPERRRSGTWATIRYARWLTRIVIVIDPQGEIHR